MNYLPLRTTWLSITILFVLLLVGCTPIQPASDAGTIPPVDSSAVLTWEGAPLNNNSACGRLVIDGNGQATFGPCGEAGQTQPLSAHAEEWAEMQTRFGAFAYITDATNLSFNGTGAVTGAAWQRALTAWAQLVYSELSAGRTGAAVATAMQWSVGAVPEQSELCQQVTVLVYGYAYAQTVPCAGGAVQETTGGWLSDEKMTIFDQWMTNFAPVYVENNYLAGIGTVEASPAWQHAMAAWAQVLYQELATGRVSATGATAMSWFVGAAANDATLCQQVTVLSYGYAYAQTVPCGGGNVQESTGALLTDAEWTQFDAWQQAYAPIYVENNYLNGVGTQAAGAAETQQIDTWAQAVYDRLQANGASTASAEAGAWQRYQADSGYHIDYPLAFYSLRAGQSGPNVLFPGVRVVEPNDAFTYRERNQTVYKLSIAVTANEQGLSLDEPAALLANSALIAYDPALLADYTMQPIELGGVPALRVDDLPVGPAGITTQIVALHGDLIYELLVEPHVLTTNQAEPFVAGAASAANRTLIEQMIGTFGFTE